MGTFKIHFALVVLSGGFALTGCNDSAFISTPKAAVQGVLEPIGGGTGNTNPPGCTVGKAKKPIRVVFMIDNSGSTNTTDPKQAIRVATIQKFISDYGSNSYLSYNFGYFSGTTALEYDMLLNKFVTNLATNAVGSSSQLSSALLGYEAVTAAGNTPYKAAFTSMSATVAEDEKAGNKQDYAVVFMSDGQPTDISGAANLKGLVDGLKSTVAGNGSAVTVNTVYFGDSTDTGSMDNLQTMATEGAGQFVDTNKLASGLVINNVINVPGANCN